MGKSLLVVAASCLSVSAFCFSQPGATQNQPAAGPVTAPAPTRITLDVLVKNKDGKPVGDLEPFDFSLLDNGKPAKILNFRRTDGTKVSQFDPPEQLILVLDVVNLPYEAISRQRLELERFLRQNGGNLPIPTSVFLFNNQGLEVQPAPSKDGNAMAAALDHSKGTIRARDITGGVYSLAEQFQDSFKTVSGIAENMARRPGRKLIVWVGPGWPLLTERFFIQTNVSRQSYFDQLAALTRKLREARISLYSAAPVVGATPVLWQGYRKPVMEARKMEIGYFALQVLAEHTGGFAHDPGNDLVEQIDDCLKDAGFYYTITLAAPPAAQPNEYHDLKVQVKSPDLTVRTTSGYYNQP